MKDKRAITVCVLIICITIAAIYFDKASILAWYILAVLLSLEQ